MGFRKASLGAMLAASMIAAPIAAQASVPARSGAEMSEASALGGDRDGGWFVPLLAILAIIAGILAATSGGEDAPLSP